MQTSHFPFYPGKFFLIWMLASMILYNCKGPENQSLTVLDIEEGIQNGSRPKLSDYCSSIEYIPLQTDSLSLVGEIRTDLLNITSDRIYLIEQTSGECKVYDKTGKYIQNIGVKGNAPGEYSTVNGFTIDEQKSYAVFMSYNKLVRYHLDGKYAGEISLDSLKETQRHSKILYGLQYAGDGKYYIGIINAGEEQQSFAILSPAGRILYTYSEPSNPGNVTVSTQGNTSVIRISSSYSYLYDNDIRLVSPNTDTIFSFSPAYEKTPVYVTRFGQYKSAPDGSNQNRAVSIRGQIIHETNNALFFRLVTGDNTFSYNKRNSRAVSVLYDKKHKKLSGIYYNPEWDATGLTNDVDHGAPFWPIRTFGNKMYQIISAINFIEYSQKSNSPAMKEVASRLTEESNPVIVVATVK